MRDRHASRASFACVRCKKNKRRCDISEVIAKTPENPTCTACRSRNVICEIRYGEDKRTNRPVNDPKALYRRIEALEERLRNVSHVEDTTGRGVSKTPSSTRSSPPLGTDRRSQGLDTFESLRHPRLSRTRQPDSSSYSQELPRDTNRTATSSLALLNSDDLHTKRPQVVVTSGMNEARTPPNDISLPRAGRNSPDFGSSALFPYSEKDSEDSMLGRDGDLVRQSKQRTSRAPPAKAGIDVYPDPEPVVMHLLDLFWKWQACHLAAVDRDIFNTHRKIWNESGGDGDRNFYSPCLLYAIMALASLVNLDAGVKRISAGDEEVAGERYAKIARSMFETEMEHPTITTVQAALILGSRYGSMVDNSLGWIYCGTALRIASKLGLHRDCSKAVATGKMSQETARLRSLVFWACFVEDKWVTQRKLLPMLALYVQSSPISSSLFSAYCNQPTCFMSWDFTIPIPNSNTSLATNSQRGLVTLTSRLYVVFSRIIVELYAQRRQRTTDQLRLLASGLHKDLWQWYQDLPHDFVLTDCDHYRFQGADVFFLHMQFYFILIVLHRPFLQFSQVVHDLTCLDDLTTTSTGTCALAAANITKLMLNYQRTNNIRQVPSPTANFAYIAGTIHLVNFRLTKLDRHWHYLQSCVAALHDMSLSYPIASKASSVLQELMERWQPSATNDMSIPPETRSASTDNNILDSRKTQDWLVIEDLPLVDLPSFPDADPASLHDPRFIDPSDLLYQTSEITSQNDLGSIADGTFPAEGEFNLADRDVFDAFYGGTFALD